VHDDWAAEDISSGALMELWKIVREKEVETPKILLFTIIKRRALNYLNHQINRQKVIYSLSEQGKQELEFRISTLKACEPEVVYEADIQNIIQTTLSNLPEQTKMIFNMIHFQGISKQDASLNLNITVKGIEYHLAKALKNLRENLKDYFPLVFFILF
jgi:RNA polymerase sigma-70 factor (ECF subfamily)